MAERERPPLPLRVLSSSPSYAEDPPLTPPLSQSPSGEMVPELGNRPIYANLGESHFGSPYIPRIIREAEEMTEGRYPSEGLKQRAVEAFRKRWQIGEEPRIFLTDGGSDRFLETMLPKMVPGGIKVLRHTPQFPQFARYARDLGRRNPVVSVHPESMLLRDGVAQLKERIQQANEQFFVYVCRPNTPLGDNEDLTTLDELADIAEENGCPILFDEAFGDVLPTKESAVQLTEKYSNVIVTGSLSKVGGFAGRRMGWMAMSPLVGDHYRQLPFAMSAPNLVRTRYLFEEGYDPFLAETLPQIEEKKGKMVSDLQRLGIHVLPTHPVTPIFAVKGHPELYETLRTRFKSAVTNVEDFGPGMKGVVRVTVLGDDEDNGDLAMNIYLAQQFLLGKFKRKG